MKTKKATKQRKATREFCIENDLKGEFEDILDEGFIDEEAYAMAIFEDEE